MPYNKAKNSVTSAIAAAALLVCSFGYSQPEQASGSQSGLAPQKGEIMESVRARLGEPVEIIPAVGEPPIIRWVYQDFTVYFENDYVIHSVIKRGDIPPRHTTP